jgi:predicted NBD/HSP70 family sugar kinase
MSTETMRATDTRLDAGRTTTRDIRRQNRSGLLSKLFFDGPLSRLELSQLTGLSSATVSTVTADLIDDRLVIEAGQVESNGGRPRVLLRVDPSYGYVIGVDVGETGVTVELFDLGMTRRASVLRPLRSIRPTPAAVVAEVVAGIQAVLTAPSPAGEGDDSEPGPVDPAKVIGIGIGVPGIVEDGDPTLVHAPTIGWHAVRLADLLAKRGVTSPVFVGNGAKTQAQAEMWFGAARGARHAVVALVGTGVGAAVITDGAPYQGVSSSAGEWGHTLLVYGGRLCRCGARGCLEAYVGAEGILDRYEQARGTAPASGRAAPGAAAPVTRPAAGIGPTGEMAAIDELIDDAAHGKRGSVEWALLEETAAYLGAGIGNLVNLFNPERVVLGGWAGLALGKSWLPQIRAAAEERSLAHPFEQVTIELSALGVDAVALGAATLPLAAFLARGADPRDR